MMESRFETLLRMAREAPYTTLKYSLSENTTKRNAVTNVTISSEELEELRRASRKLDALIAQMKWIIGEEGV